MAYAAINMAQSAPPPHEGDDKQLGRQRKTRTELLAKLLEGQPPLTAQELQQARRGVAFSLLRENARRRETVREELSRLFEELDTGKGIPTTDEEFTRMVREHGAWHREQ